MMDNLWLKVNKEIANANEQHKKGFFFFFFKVFLNESWKWVF